MNHSQLAALIDEFIRHTSDYLAWANLTRIAVQSLRYYNPKLQRVGGGDAPQRLGKAMDMHREARANMLQTGRELAPSLEAMGQDSSSLLKVLHCADGGGGPEAVSPLWPDLKVSLQRLTFELRGGKDKSRALSERLRKELPTLDMLSRQLNRVLNSGLNLTEQGESKDESPADAGQFIERLLAGPGDVELTPRDMALLEAYLRQPISFAAIQREKRATGRSQTQENRNKLKLIRDFNWGLREEQAPADATEQSRDAAPAVTPKLATKRSTERGEAVAKLIAALTKHHQYADGVCLNLEPIRNNELARLAGVSRSTASAFFNDKFQGHAKYKVLCRDAGKLRAALKLLNDEFAPYHLLGAASADLAAPEEEDTDAE